MLCKGKGRSLGLVLKCTWLQVYVRVFVCVCVSALVCLFVCFPCGYTNYKGQRCEGNPQTGGATGQIKYTLYYAPQSTSNATRQFKEACFQFMISNLRVGSEGGRGRGLCVWSFFGKSHRSEKKLSRGDGVEGNRWATEATAGFTERRELIPQLQMTGPSYLDCHSHACQSCMCENCVRHW